MAKKNDDNGKLAAMLAALRAAAEKRHESSRAIGDVLYEMEQAGLPVELYQATILKDQFQISLAESTCLLRWAKGELGPEKVADAAIRKIPASVLQNMTKAAIKEAVTGRHAIISRSENRVCEKSFDEMSSREVSDNINDQGFMPIGPRTQSEPEFRACKARSFKIDGDFVVFEGHSGQTIRMKVPPKMIEQAHEALGAASAS